VNVVLPFEQDLPKPFTVKNQRVMYDDVNRVSFCLSWHLQLSFRTEYEVVRVFQSFYLRYLGYQTSFDGLR